MIETDKILSGKYDKKFTEHLQPISNGESRGHHLKPHHRRPITNLRKYNFTYRTVHHHIIESSTINTFERKKTRTI